MPSLTVSNFKLSTSQDPILASPTQGASAFEQLVSAIRSNHPTLFEKAMLEISDPSRLFENQDGTGATLLHLAAEYVRPSFLRALLSLPNASTYINTPTRMEKNTPLHFLMMNAHGASDSDIEQCFSCFTAADANLTVSNAEGASPLDIATGVGRTLLQSVLNQRDHVDLRDVVSEAEELEMEQEDEDE